MAEQSLNRVQEERARVMKNYVHSSHIDFDIRKNIIEGPRCWDMRDYGNVFDWEDMVNALRNIAKDSSCAQDAIDVLDELHRLSRQPEFLEDKDAQKFRREQLQSLEDGAYGRQKLDLLLELAQQSDGNNDSEQEKEIALKILKEQVVSAFNSYIEIEDYQRIESLGKKLKPLWQSNEDFSQWFFDFIEKKTQDGHYQFPVLFADMALHSDEFLDRFLSIVHQTASQNHDTPVFVDLQENPKSWFGQNVLYSYEFIANHLIEKNSYRENSEKIASIFAAMMGTSSEQDSNAKKANIAEMIKENQFKKLIEFIKENCGSDKYNEKTVGDIAFEKLCKLALEIVYKNIPSGLSGEIAASNFPTAEDIKGVPHSIDAKLLEIERNDLKRQLERTRSELRNTQLQLENAMAGGLGGRGGYG